MNASAIAIKPPEGQEWVQTRQASLVPTTISDGARTVEVAFTTGATVRRVSWFDGKFDEQLVVDAKSVRLGRLNNGASVLDSHEKVGVRNIVGVVERAWLTGSEGRATVRFSEREDVEPIWRDVKAGIIRNISVGYFIHRADKIERDKDVPLIRVVDWEPIELSLVPVPADAGAQVRSSEVRTMTTTDTVPAGDVERQVQERLKAEQERCSRIRKACAFAKMSAAVGERLISLNTPADVAVAEIIDAGVARDAARGEIATISGGADWTDPDAIARRMQGALLHRADPARYALPPEAAEFRGCSLVELRRRLLEANGVSCRGWSADRVLAYRQTDGWLGRGGSAYMTTSDLPALLTGTGQRILEDSYALAGSPLKSHSRERSAEDFRAITSLRFGNISPLAKVDEHGEVTRGAAAEAKESFRVETYAKIWAFSRQSIVNDDLGALTDWASEMGAAAAETENGLFVTVLTTAAGAGVTLDDGTPLFHANRGNLASPGTALDTTNVGLARQAMRAQTGVGGVFPTQVTPVAILVSPAQEVAAEKVVAELTPATVSEVNVFSGRLRVETEPRFSGNGWYLVSENPPLQHAYLNGVRGPQLDQREGFDVLGVEFRCVFDVGVHVRDFRFIFKNPGA